MNRQQALNQYEENFDEPLFNNYLIGLTDEEVVQIVQLCMEKNKTYVEILQDEYGEDVDI